MQMEQKIAHSYLSIRGLELHIAHIGEDEQDTVLFVHGFPEVWYSWRHQMVAAAAAGFHAVALEFPGYGLSEPPADLGQASWEDLNDDLLAVLDSLSISKAFLVAKDFGVKPAFDLALFHPDQVSGVVTLGVPPITESLSFSGLPEGFYIHRWGTVMRTIYVLFSRKDIPIAKEGQEIMNLADESTPIPEWFTEEDLSAYTALYQKSGFITALQIPYRTKLAKLGLANPTFEVPMFVIMGEIDYILKFPELKDYMCSEGLKEVAPDLEITYVPEGSHFVQEQFPDIVNQLMMKFIKKHA